MPDFVILGNCLWNSKGRGGNSSQQYALAVMRRGWRVRYVDRYGTGLFTPWEDLEIGPETVVMCDMPWVKHYYTLFMELKMRGCRTVYRAVDNWHMTPRRDDYDEEREIAFITAADAAFASNPLNVERFKKIRPDITLLRNGTDLALFWNWQGEPPEDLRPGKPAVAFVASLWAPEWVDWESLFYAAEASPELSFNFLADPSKFPDRARPANMNVIGIRRWPLLPSYLHHCGVGVLPYFPERSCYTNPLKVLEYLACGLPVVCCPNPSIMDCPHLFFYSGPRDFLDKIKAAAEAEIDREALYHFLEQHTWDRRLEDIVEKLGFSAPVGSRGAAHDSAKRENRPRGEALA